MALIEHDFLGAMDLDTPVSKVMPGFVIGARNVIWRGFPNKRRAESVPGTNARVNLLLPAGVNKCIGCWYDAVNQQIYDFNYNSNGNHGIYIYSTMSSTWQRLLEVGIGTDGDILGFTASGRITSIALIYGDNNSGNLLVYVDSLGRPTKINVQRYLAITYNPVKRSFIDLIKAPPRMPPRVTYENDPNCTINNMRNALFQFRYRWVYDDNDKSVYSTCSIVALPNTPFSQTIDSDPTQNCRESIYLSTGDVDVKKIELWVKQVTDAGASEWLLVTSLDKSVLGINNNDFYRYLFYNDGVYTAGNPNEINLLFDYVPRGTNSLVLLNGNVIMFGGITEGYNGVPVNVNLSTNNTYNPPVTTVNGVLFAAFQSGVDSNGTDTLLKVVLTGTGVNDGLGNPTTIPLIGNTNAFAVDCATTGGTSLKFTYSNSGSSTSITTILNGLKTAALSQGFTLVSQTQNVLTLSYSGFVLYNAQVYNDIGSVGTFEATLAYGHRDVYQFGIEYFDDKGRTNGTLIPVDSSIQTQEDLSGNTIPQIVLSIFSRPPVWASYYQVVRSLNLTYAKRLFWVSNSTFSAIDQGTGTKYAYINIGNMADYNATIQASTPVVSYEFGAGDRIQFLQNIPFGGGSPVNLTIKNDYEILAVVDNPINQGVTQTGRFIKIQYPTADINSNFDFGGSNFQNYKILLYSYVKHASQASNLVFYEFGRCFAIGNAGTSNAFHVGSDQTQTANLSQPAIISTVEGDMYWRQRVVPAGNSYFFPVQGQTLAFPYNRFITVITPDVITPNYSLIGNDGSGGAQPVGPTAGVRPFYSDNDPLTWNTSGSLISFRLRGSVQVQPDNTSEHNGTFGLMVKVVASTGVVTLYTAIQDQTGLEAPNTYTYTYDVSYTLNPGDKAWMITHAVNHMQLLNGQQRIDALDNITIPIIEYSYSDKYNIVTNSNGRTTVYDPNAGEFYYNTLVRWGQQYQLGTNLNNSNRFYAQDFDEFDKQFGDIMRLIPRNREVDVFQKRKCGHVAVYGRFVQNNQGQQELLTTDAIITQNNIQYYNGDYGVGNQSDAIATSGFQRWFLDPVKGVIVRLSLNGCEPISDLFKTQTWAGANLPNYLNNYTYTYGGNSVMLGAYHVSKDREAEILFFLQEGTNGTGSIPAQTIAYEEAGTRFTAFHDYAPDAVLNAENMLYSFKNGTLYSHDNNTTAANFYGVQQTPQITCVFNDMILEKKTWISMFQIGNRQWNAPLIYTDVLTYGTQRQESRLVDGNFALLESRWESSFFRDVNSPKGWINGDVLKGGLLVAQLQVSSPQNFAYLANIGVKFIPSQLTQK